MSIIDFLNDCSVSKDEVYTHTWMFGGDNKKQSPTPMGGRFYIPEHLEDEFYQKYICSVKSGPLKISELRNRFRSPLTRLVLDIDGTKKIDRVRKSLRIILKQNFKVVGNLDMVSIPNSKHEDKYHLHVMCDDKPLSVNKHYLTNIIGQLKEKYPEVDENKSLRLLGSVKKDGKEAGVYLPEEKLSVEVMKKYSINYRKGDVELQPTSEFEKECRNILKEKIKEQQSRKDNDRLIPTLEEEEIHKRIDVILPIIQQHGYLDKRDTWFAVLAACKNANYPAEKVDELCKISENYTDGCVDEFYKQKNKQGKGFTIGTLQYYLKNCNAEAYSKYKAEFYSVGEGGSMIDRNLLFRGDIGHAEYVAQEIKGNIVFVDKKTGYEWKEKTKLWEPIAYDSLHIIVSRILEKDLEQCVSILSKDESKKETCEIARACLNKSRKLSHIKNVMGFLITLIMDPTWIIKLNNMPYFLPIKNGELIDLRTGDIRDRVKSDVFDFECPVTLGDYKNKKVRKFFSTVMSDEKERVDYLQKVLGFSLFGNPEEQRSIFVLHGNGANGKSVIFSKFIPAILQRYTAPCMKSLFVMNKNTKGNACSPETECLVGTRMVVCSETTDGDKLNSDLLKNISGGDAIIINPKYSPPYQYKTMAQLFLVTNDFPDFSGNDTAIIERMKYLPFEVKFVENPSEKHHRQKDTQLIDDLLINHIDDIFAWIVEGCKKYMKTRKLIAPEVFNQELETLRDESDTISMFIENVIIDKVGERVLRQNVYSRYFAYCKDHNLETTSNRAFYKCMKEKKYKLSAKTRHGYYYENINITQEIDFESRTMK